MVKNVPVHVRDDKMDNAGLLCRLCQQRLEPACRHTPHPHKSRSGCRLKIANDIGSSPQQKLGRPLSHSSDILDGHDHNDG